MSRNSRCQLKILWLTSSFPRYEDDSASVFLYHLATAISKQELELHILTPDHIAASRYRKNKNTHIYTFRYFFPRGLQKLAYGSGILPNLKSQPWLLLQVPFFLLSLCFSTARLLIKLKPDVIHAHWIFPMGTIASFLGKLFRIPAIITAHGSDSFALQGSILSNLKQWSIRNCSAWTSNTQATAHAAGQNLPKPHIIPMGIDYRKFSSGNRLKIKATLPEKMLVLLFIGRLIKNKGVFDLVNAYALLPDEIKKKTVLWLIGEGSDRGAVSRLSTRLKIDHKITFLGQIPNDRLPDYYAAADIFIAPSLAEGQGVILLEAMASHTPVIATATGGIPEVITQTSDPAVLE
jgi:glycosyltransferase involved in cell wall biosynthesis